jgi:P27 family predicted phage terminase small subunit
MGAMIPQILRERIPAAEWMDNPEAWTKHQFIEQTAEYLFSVYGLGTAQDRHILTMLADQIEAYIDCCRHIAEHGQIILSHSEFGEVLKTNPAANLRDKIAIRIVSLMGELGLTPRSRLATGKQDATPVGNFLKGVSVK